jgi:hypothetical protein
MRVTRPHAPVATRCLRAFQRTGRATESGMSELCHDRFLELIDPNFKKQNQHYVPQFWQRRFADSTGQLYVRYSLRPYDVLEDRLAEAENEIKRTEDQILSPATLITPDLRRKFCWGVAIASCRLPHVMKRAHRRRIDLAHVLADVGRMGRAVFDAKLADFGQILTDADYDALKARPTDGLIATAIGLSQLSPQDPNFPEQDALQAVGIVTEVFNCMDIEILESTGSPSFIIGDTPILDSDLASGSTVPLSKTAAARFRSATATPIFSRTTATPAEVAAINQEQYDNSMTHVIGPDAAYLDSLA